MILKPASSTHTTRPLFLFSLVNLLLSLGSAVVIIHTADLSRIASIVFAWAAFFEELALVALAIVVIVWGIGRASVLGSQIVASLSFTVLHAILFVDIVVFSLFRFHINGLVWNVVTSPGGLEAAHISGGEIAAFVAAVCVLFGAEIFVFRWLSRRRSASQTPMRRVWLWFVVVVFTVSLIERVVFAASDVWDYRPVLSASRAVPLYQWLTVKSWLRKRGWLTGAGELGSDELGSQDALDSRGVLNYPRAPLRTHVPKERPSILIVALDSMRADMLVPTITPRLDELAHNAQYFSSYYSGGNSTRFGIFTLFYGLYGSYWHEMLSERRPPVILDRVRDLRYRTAAFASARLSWPEFHETVFKGGLDVGWTT